VADAWIQSGDPRVGARCLPFGDWWSVFEDPVLNDLIYTAYEQNPNLRTAATRVLQARAGQAISVGNLLPQSQQAIASYARANLNPNMPLIGTLAKVPGAAATSLAFSNWFYGFNLSWELDLWGRLRRSVESANAALDASVEDYDAAIVTLVSDVASSYVQYRVAQQRIKIAQANVQIQQNILSLAEEKFRVGTTNRLDVEQARTVLEQTRSTIPALEINLGQANDTLCTLLGIPPRDLEAQLGPGPDLGQSPIPMTPESVAAGIPADLLRRRPDVRSAERQVAAQSAQIGVAEADLYPTIFVNGTIGWDAENFSQAFATKSFIGLLLPGFRWNILNYGRVMNNIHLQEARLQELIATYQNQVLTAAREVQVPLRGFIKSREQAGDLARSYAAAAAATEVGSNQYRTGVIDFNRVFNLETTQVQQQDRLAVAQGDIALYLISVYRALGGWEIRLPRDTATTGGMAPPASVASPGPAAVPPPPGSPPAFGPVEVPRNLPSPARPQPVAPALNQLPAPIPNR
jgi:NodT family efflux transporter outer membrane factor (OMF) lipoprotein